MSGYQGSVTLAHGAADVVGGRRDEAVGPPLDLLPPFCGVPCSHACHLLHTGASAHSGHYTARILEQSREERWLTFNDELVSEQAFDAAKAASKAETNGVTLLKKVAPGGGRLFASRNAYMLLYTREDKLERAKACHAEVQAPTALREAVEADGTALRADGEEYEIKLAAHKERVAERASLLEELRPILRSDGRDGRWIQSARLQDCLTHGPMGRADGAVGEIDNGAIACAHGEADPRHVGSGGMKLISTAGWQKLMGLFGGGPELRAAGCMVCADAAWQGKQRAAGHEEHKVKLASALGASSNGSAGGGGGGGGGGGDYHVPKHLAKKWSRWLSDGQSDITRELFCAHGKLLPLDANARTISAEAWGHLVALFPDSVAVPVECVGVDGGGGGNGGNGRLVECAACLVEHGEKEAVKAGEKASAKEENAARSMQKQKLGRLLQEDSMLDAATLLSSKQLYLLDASWVAAWRLSMQSAKADKPGPLLGAERCAEHGQLLVRPELCVGAALEAVLAPSAGGGGNGGEAPSGRERERDKRLGTRVCMVTEDEAVGLANGARLSKAAMLPLCRLHEGIFECEPPVCKVCSAKLGEEVLSSLLEYSEQPLHVKKLAALPVGAAAVESSSGGAGGGGGGGGGATDSGGGGSRPARRSSRAGAGSNLTVTASSSANVLNLKLRIYQTTDWLPSQQRLFIDGCELLDDTQTLADAGVLPNSVVHVFVDTSRAAEMPEIEEAFGGDASGGGKARAPEDGFVGSALVSSFGAPPKSAAPAGEGDASSDAK